MSRRTQSVQLYYQGQCCMQLVLLLGYFLQLLSVHYQEYPRLEQADQKLRVPAFHLCAEHHLANCLYRSFTDRPEVVRDLESLCLIECKPVNKGQYTILLWRKTDFELATFATEKEAIKDAKGSTLGDWFGFEVFKMGDGERYD